MITFDKLKIVSAIENITINNVNAFEKKEKNGRVQSLSFHQEYPYLLRIKIDYSEHEFVLEFTGKVLGADYPKLISSDTIKQCFENINNLGICNIDIEAMMNSQVVTCDVTKDIECHDISRLSAYIRGHIRNYQQFNCKARCGNVTIERNVLTRKFKKRMIIYDKGREMSSAENRKFVQEYGLEGMFDNVCRLEMNLNSKHQIRESLGITDNTLSSVLESDANPIASFITEAVSPPSEPVQYNDRKSYFISLVLKDCDYDLAKVEARMRELYRHGTKFSNVMKPYREALDAMSQCEDDTYSSLIDKLQ
ncbi:MAG: hypothetical protein J6W42_02860 [Bacteroidaceae bacterium]|nr:hypothetical protein [Bacteroidaceae bacterium]